MATLVLIHGLNTYGDSDVRLGPLRLGSMYGPLKKAFEEKGHKVFELYNLGFASIEMQTASAAVQLDKLLKIHKIDKFHILAQSTGGLIARQLSYHPQIFENLISITTLGCPHQGTNLPHWTRTLSQNKPTLYKLLKMFRYPIEDKQNVFDQFTPEKLTLFTKAYPLRFDIVQQYALCEVSQNELSWPLALLQKIKPQSFKQQNIGDGLIESSSQQFGVQIGTFQLDHFAQIGCFLSPDPRIRKKMTREFNQLVQLIHTMLIHTTQAP